MGWLGLVLLLPVLGTLLYLMFGVNRVQRRARKVRKKKYRLGIQQFLSGSSTSTKLLSREPLTQLISGLSPWDVADGNRITPCASGHDAYEQMLAAIASAQNSVSLSTYLFDNDRIGKVFVKVLAEAVARGVEVRVLIDAIGANYTWPSVVRSLKSGGVTVSLFLPSLLPWHFVSMNLRNHRKILIIDGKRAFFGGMNIREGHDETIQSLSPIRDQHFVLEGPIVAQCQHTFADDWLFTTNERLQGTSWYPKLSEVGEQPARLIPIGPDENDERLLLLYMGALSCARTSVRIMTPYFLPDSGLVNALNVTAMRGVSVDIVLPAHNNLKTVEWASMAHLHEVLGKGCKVWMSPPPFDHSKLMIVDDSWSLFGSANWDPRSFRLNFEVVIESSDPGLARELAQRIDASIAQSRQLTLQHLEQRSLPVKLRDGIARLLTPYL